MITTVIVIVDVILVVCHGQWLDRLNDCFLNPTFYFGVQGPPYLSAVCSRTSGNYLKFKKKKHSQAHFSDSFLPTSLLNVMLAQF